MYCARQPLWRWQRGKKEFATDPQRRVFSQESGVAAGDFSQMLLKFVIVNAVLKGDKSANRIRTSFPVREVTVSEKISNDGELCRVKQTTHFIALLIRMRELTEPNGAVGVLNYNTGANLMQENEDARLTKRLLANIPLLTKTVSKCSDNGVKSDIPM